MQVFVSAATMRVAVALQVQQQAVAAGTTAPQVQVTTPPVQTRAIVLPG